MIELPAVEIRPLIFSPIVFHVLMRVRQSRGKTICLPFTNAWVDFIIVHSSSTWIISDSFIKADRAESGPLPGHMAFD